jgi:hypothetical protein
MGRPLDFQPSPLRRQGPMSLATSGGSVEKEMGPCLRRGDGFTYSSRYILQGFMDFGSGRGPSVLYVAR